MLKTIDGRRVTPKMVAALRELAAHPGGAEQMPQLNTWRALRESGLARLFWLRPTPNTVLVRYEPTADGLRILAEAAKMRSGGVS